MSLFGCLNRYDNGYDNGYNNGYDNGQMKGKDEIQKKVGVKSMMEGGTHFLTKIKLNKQKQTYKNE